MQEGKSAEVVSGVGYGCISLDRGASKIWKLGRLSSHNFFWKITVTAMLNAPQGIGGDGILQWMIH